MIIDIANNYAEEKAKDFWTWSETNPVQMLPGGATKCQPHWSQGDRRWFNDYWKVNMGLAFFKELPDGTLVSWSSWDER